MNFIKSFWTAVKAAISHGFKLVSDPFQDKNGDYDEKRIIGVGFLIGGFFYAIGRFGPVDTSVLTILIGTGISLLGGAIVGDVNNPKSGQ